MNTLTQINRKENGLDSGWIHVNQDQAQPKPDMCLMCKDPSTALMNLIGHGRNFKLDSKHKYIIYKSIFKI